MYRVGVQSRYVFEVRDECECRCGVGVGYCVECTNDTHTYIYILHSHLCIMMGSIPW